jgi:hypothetical protein
MEGALRARLIVGPAVSAILPDYTPPGQISPTKPVFWDERPQESTLPAITLEDISGDYPRTHGGLQATRDPRVQLNAWGRSSKEAKSLISAAISDLAAGETSNGITFEPMRFENEGTGGVQQLGATKVFQRRIDLIVWHYPA